MIGAIAGDIIGSRFEGDDSPPAIFDLFHEHCEFTDDTVCSLAVADALLHRRDFARTLRKYVRRHPDRGYGGLFREWALDPQAGPYGSWGNGAPMRAVAVGWLVTDEAQALEVAAAQSVVSHDHPDAVAASQAVALTILLLRRGNPADAVRVRMSSQFGYDLRPEAAFAQGGFDVSAAGTMPPALAAAFEATCWEGAVRTAVGLGGDTDTLACIAGAVAEAMHGVPDAIAARARAYLTTDLAKVLATFERAVNRRGKR